MPLSVCQPGVSASTAPPGNDPAWHGHRPPAGEQLQIPPFSAQQISEAASRA
jgi:hypothetical protein